MKEFFSAKRIAKIAIFAAMSFALYLINIPLAILFPAFLELNLSDFPALIGGFSLGPASGAIIVFVKILMKLPFSDTMCVGELSDLLNGLAFVVPSAVFYKHNKTKKGALIALLIGSACSIFTAAICNRFIIIPFYIKALGVPMAALVDMCSIIKNITVDNFYFYYELFAVLPFNLLRCVVASLVTFFAYKSLTGVINRIDGGLNSTKKKNVSNNVSESSAETLNKTESKSDNDELNQ